MAIIYPQSHHDSPAETEADALYLVPDDEHSLEDLQELLESAKGPIAPSKNVQSVLQYMETQTMGRSQRIVPVYDPHMPRSQLNRAGRRAQKRLGRGK